MAGLEGIPEIYAKVVSKVPDAQVMSDLDATVAWAEKNRETQSGSRLQAFAGADVSSGYTRRTARLSKPAPRGTEGSPEPPTRSNRGIRLTSQANSKRP